MHEGLVNWSMEFVQSEVSNPTNSIYYSSHFVWHRTSGSLFPLLALGNTTFSKMMVILVVEPYWQDPVLPTEKFSITP